MEKTARRYHRIGSRYGPMFLITLLVVGVLCFGFWYLQKNSQEDNPWQSVVITGDPVVVWSVNSESRDQRILSIPSDMYIQGIYGYGSYTLDALVQLGAMDKTYKRLMVDSLSEAIGLPIQYFIIGGDDTSIPSKRINTLFKLSTLTQFINRSYQTNMGLRAYAFFRNAQSQVNSVQIKSIDARAAFFEETLPDGTKIRKIDMGMMDQRMGSTYELTSLRKEGYTVGILNTTSVPALGNSVGRTLSHLGMFVSLIGNADRKLQDCEVQTDKEKLASKTVRLIVSLYHCKESMQTSDRADIMIYMGTKYARRFEADSK